MWSSLKWMLPAAAAVGFWVGLSSVTAKAADAAAGVITGSVVDKDGNAVADATVHLVKPRQHGAKPGGPTASGTAAEPGAGGPGDAGPGGAHPEPLATATTGSDGKFTLNFDTTKVPDGDYGVVAMVKGKGVGHAKVTIKSGIATPSDVSLKLQERHHGGGGNGGPGAAGGTGGAGQDAPK